jgi:hypothetical protein
MLVHKFYLVECIEFEFKSEFEFNYFEWSLKKKSGKGNQKQEPKLAQ